MKISQKTFKNKGLCGIIYMKIKYCFVSKERSKNEY